MTYYLKLVSPPKKVLPSFPSFFCFDVVYTRLRVLLLQIRKRARKCFGLKVYVYFASKVRHEKIYIRKFMTYYEYGTFFFCFCNFKHFFAMS